MSTGISISSINRIKELAEEKRYAEALEILDTQNLDKSINPQFLRISGEIFRKNKRYYDSRRILLKAHQMSPQGTRIIYELIQLYLELGYFTLVNRYYEEYRFYVGQEDTQKEYVEYIVKKASGADVMELAEVLIPVLERMPEDCWNYEAVLLYDKMDRKDKALDEARFILENYKASAYTQRVIDYIEDRLDVDKEFYIYPKEEQKDDEGVFSDLIMLEQSILEKDFLVMYPPEARIMVEADDKDGYEVKPVKEKKPKKKRIRKSKDKENEQTEENNDVTESQDTSSLQEDVDLKKDNEIQEKRIPKETVKTEEDLSAENMQPAEEDSSAENMQPAEKDSLAENMQPVEKDSLAEEVQSAEADTSAEEMLEPELSDEERVAKQRKEELERILARKIDADTIKESAKQLADSIKGLDTSKAKKQVKYVKSSVLENVKKATEVIGDAVGTNAAIESTLQEDLENNSEEIVDGIIEGILEPPKQAIGQVVMNEELDALVPDSLEAMSTEEIADIEARKEEQERLELEALESSLKLEEEKRGRKLFGKSDKSEKEPEEEVSAYTQLKSKYMDEYMREEVPAESLGFVTIVHSDVDADMEENLPDTAQMLRRMIGNKEFYAEESSLGFESKASYEDHGFVVEDYEVLQKESVTEQFFLQQHYNSDVYKVEDIYIDEPVLSFDDLAPEEVVPMEDYVQSDEWRHKTSSEGTEEFAIAEDVISDGDETISIVEDFDMVMEMDEMPLDIQNHAVLDEIVEAVHEDFDEIVEAVHEDFDEIVEAVHEDFDEIAETESKEQYESFDFTKENEKSLEELRRQRVKLRSEIRITQGMEEKLSALKMMKE